MVKGDHKPKRVGNSPLEESNAGQPVGLRGHQLSECSIPKYLYGTGRGYRGVNIQHVPRYKAVSSVFGAHHAEIEGYYVWWEPIGVETVS